MTDRRLIEVAFPLEQTSLDSVHEKNVRHGHISTLHIWPARRPLAACRAALIAALLPDPGTPEKRKELCERIGGKVIKAVRRKKLPNGKVEEQEYKTTHGGILHWGRETENKADIEWFREEIRKAYGGRAPKLLDMFAGGGAIPLEGMRLGCEVTAIDINPVAWFILKCTLEYPQKLAGQKRRLPDFTLRDREFMTGFFEAQGFRKPQIRTFLKELGLEEHDPTPPLPGIAGQNVDPALLEADLAWHVRAWGRWVLAQARKELARFYPTYAEFQTLEGHGDAETRGHGEVNDAETRRHGDTEIGQVAASPRHRVTVSAGLRLVPLKDDGTPDIDSLNDEVLKEVFAKDKKFLGQNEESRQYRQEKTEGYFKNKSNPRWVAKPAVAYLWARTVKCKNCRATIPLLKTRWLAKKDRKRVLLQMEVVEETKDSETRRRGDAEMPGQPERKVAFSILNNVPQAGGNNAIRREHDRKIGQGTMSRSGAWCPCCGKPGTVAMTMEDIRAEGLAGRLGAVMTAVVVDGPEGKEYRLPTEHELAAATPSAKDVDRVFKDVPFGIPGEPLPSKEALGFRMPLYGFDSWHKLFLPRALIAMGRLVQATREAARGIRERGFEDEWVEAICVMLAAALGRLADYMSISVTWTPGGEFAGHTFLRYALPMVWDCCEPNPIVNTSGTYMPAIDWVARAVESTTDAVADAHPPRIKRQSALQEHGQDDYDAVITDPPYYNAIPYSDLMDFFYVWHRRTLFDLAADFTAAFREPLAPKWDHAANDGELIDDSSRHNGNAGKSKAAYEDGMCRAFQQCGSLLSPNGRLVVVFAHKHPDAWETLVSATIRSGFIVEGSWPIQTEREVRTRALSSAALASSVWLVCKKRPQTARPGWDNTVLAEMRSRIYDQLRSFWDAGIRGPDFVWAATGPAMEAYSKHPIVKKADTPGELMSVSEFLRAVRRIVVDFVVGRVLSEAEAGGRGDAETRGRGDTVSQADWSLDDVTTYYLLHRHDFGMDDAPAGACILYAVSCNLSEAELADKYDVLVRSGGVDRDDNGEPDEGDADAEGEAEEGTGSTFKLKPWKQRKRPGMGGDVLTRGWGDAATRGLFDAETRGRGDAENALSPRLRVSESPRPQMVPLIDQVHRLMHLWKAGDQIKVDAYLEERGLRRNAVFQPLLQALIELSPEGSEERSVLESIMNHVRARGVAAAGTAQLPFAQVVDDEVEG